ncbi:MAG: transglutaminase domain-containing protein [Spirochaetales bacterium]|nr:transglutaminase domain-containing protein [Spirochaetales bacterium]
MSGRFEDFKTPGTDILVFILRNSILYALIFHAYLYFREDLDILFISVSFSIAVITAILMEKIRLRFVISIIVVILIIIIIRGMTFFLFKTLSPLDPGLEKDFFYFFFDRDFFPAILPCFVAWFFNFLALRKPGFVQFEIGCNAIFLLVIFYTQADYNITLYHPTFFGIFLGLYVLAEIFILLLASREKTRLIQKKRKGENVKRILSYLWIIVPLFFLLLLYFFLLDRYNKDSAKARGGLMESTMFRFDLSRYIKLQSEIKLSDELVLIMRKNGPASRLLLRRFVLSEYQPGGGFFQSQKKGIDDIPVVVPDSTQVLADPHYTAREQVTQEYFLINLDPTSFIAMNYPVKIIPYKNWEDSSFLRIYKVESMVNQLEIYGDEFTDKEEIDLPPELYQFYTYYGDDEPVRELAIEITEYSFSYLDKVMDIENYLMDNYLYSLKPGIAKDGNQLHHFLFESKKGYCSYFAFAMALMCRSIGIPARVVVGFFANPEWEVLNFYEIRANQAHAWVEVYFNDLGWIEFDPTSTTIAPGEDISFLFDFKMDERLKNLISEILENEDTLKEEEKKETDGILERIRFFSFIVIQISSWLLRYWFIIIPLLYLCIMILIKDFHLLVYFMAGNNRRKIKSLFLYSMGILYSLGIVRKTNESLVEYAERIEYNKRYHITFFRPWADFYLKAVFGHEFTEDDYHQAKQAFDIFRIVVKQNISPVKRLISFLNPLNSFKRKI